MSIRKLAALTLVLAGLAACTTANYGGSGAGSGAAATNADSALHSNSYGYGTRYQQFGHD